MILRDLVTRFSFVTDEKGVKKYNSTLAGMRGNLKKFLGVIGVGLGAKEMYDLGQAASQAHFDLRRFAQTNFMPLQRIFYRVQNQIDQIRKGAGDIIKKQDFDRAATGFIKLFGNNNRSIDQFKKIWEFSAKQAALTGKSVESIVDEIEQGIQGGGFSTLLDIPGFNLYRKQLMEWQQNVINPNEPGGLIAIKQRMQTMLKAINAAGPEQDKSISKIPNQLLQARDAATQFQKVMINIGKVVLPEVAKVLEKINATLEKFNRNASEGGIIEGGIKTLPENMQSPARKTVTTTKKVYNKIGSQWQNKYLPAISLIESVLSTQRLFGSSNDEAKKSADKINSYNKSIMSGKINRGGQGAPIVEQTNHIHVSNPDPKAAAEEIDRRLKQRIDDARNKILRTEND